MRVNKLIIAAALSAMIALQGWTLLEVVQLSNRVVALETRLAMGNLAQH